MTEKLVSVSKAGTVASVRMQNPPVNVLSQQLRVQLRDALGEVARDPAIKVVVIDGGGRTFSAGMDMNEFAGEPLLPTLQDVITAIERLPAVSVAAIRGSVFGGGLELAMACNSRVVGEAARLILPEASLGIIPGAGGTQRAPRLMGVDPALSFIVSGKPLDAETAVAAGLADRVLPDSDFDIRVAEYARSLADSGERPPLARERAAEAPSPTYFDEASARAQSDAERAAIGAIRAAVELPFDEGIAREAAIAADIVSSPVAVARRHAFFAERAASQVPGLGPAIPSADLGRVGVIGGGQMGSGIATALLAAGSNVTLIEAGDAARNALPDRIRGHWANQVKRGKLTTQEVEDRIARLTIAADLNALADHQLVIEAVWESMPLKKEIFGELDRILPPDAVLATNTSTLDINEIASATNRPESVIGLHFFSPAYVMRLLEVVRGTATSDRCLATSLALAKHLRKIPVVVGVCDGFVGNRLFAARDNQANRMLLEGASPEQIDGALQRFGFAMGTFTIYDMVGAIELGWRIRQESGEREIVGDALYAAGRLGQRVGAGYYRYEPGNRTPLADPAFDAILAELRRAEGITPRDISEEEIIERMILPMINESAKILAEGIATRASDIDVVWNTGYGWPIDKGGPAFYGDVLGLAHVTSRLEALQQAHGDYFKPAPALTQLATAGRTLASAGRG